MSIYRPNEWSPWLMTPYDFAAETAMPSLPEFYGEGSSDRASAKAPMAAPAPMVDPFARRIDYVRVSVTDR